MCPGSGSEVFSVLTGSVALLGVLRPKIRSYELTGTLIKNHVMMLVGHLQKNVAVFHMPSVPERMAWNSILHWGFTDDVWDGGLSPHQNIHTDGYHTEAFQYLWVCYRAT